MSDTPDAVTPPPPSSTPAPPPPPPAATPPIAAPSSAVAGGATGQVGKLRSIGLTIILTIITLGVWAWVWAFKNGSELKAYTGRGLGGGLTLLLTILISPVVMFTIPGEIEQMYKADGRKSPVSALWGLWFLLPLIGNLIWYIKVQEALNKFWESKGQNNTPGL